MTSPTDEQDWGTLVPVYEQILRHCRSLKFPPPWDFLEPERQCMGPVADPTAAVADLRGRFDDGTLQAAGVLDAPSPDGPQLKSVFTSPETALIALRQIAFGSLIGLLTLHGWFPPRAEPAMWVVHDSWTYQALPARELLYASPDIREVAILRSLGMPATLSLGLHRLNYQGLRVLDSQFREDPLCDTFRCWPTLVLLGWSPLSLSAEPSPALLPAVKHLIHAREDLDIELRGVCTWRLGADDVENVRYWTKLRSAETIRMLLRKRVDDTLFDIETLLPTSPVREATAADRASAYASARADLVHQLAKAPHLGPLPGRARRARKVYDEQVRRTLIQPLEKSFLECPDPVERNVGMRLARVFELLHRTDPLILSQLVREYDRANQGVCTPLPSELFKQVLCLTGNMSKMVRDLCFLRKA